MEVTKDQWKCTDCFLLYTTKHAARECHGILPVLMLAVTFEVPEDGPDLFTDMEERLRPDWDLTS